MPRSDTSGPSGRTGRLDALRRRLAPRLSPRAYWLLRRLVCLAAPLFAAVQTGQWRSAVTGKVVDKAGRPLPWLTYPAIDFLASLDLTGRRVLEFGSGYSTLWWAERVDKIIAFEAEATWFEQVSSTMPANATVLAMPTDPTDKYHRAVGLESVLERELGDQRFDVIVIDGADRVGSAHASLPYLADDGIVVVDNSDSHMFPDGSMPLLDVYREAGFQRVDFYGLGPSILFPQCTSIAFREGAFAFRGGQNTTWLKPFARKSYGEVPLRDPFVPVDR